MSKSSKKLVVIALLLLTSIMFLSACSGQKQELSKLEEIKKEGKIVLGTAAGYPPYEFHKQINGEDHIVGLDIEIAKEIANDLGVELEIKDMRFDGLLAALKAGNIDFIVAAMVPTEERAKSVEFSNIYYQAEQKFVTKVGKGIKYKTIEDLDGLKLGVQKATVQEKIATEAVNASEVKALSKTTDVVLELKNDKVEGIILAKPVAEAYTKNNDDLEIADLLLGNQDGVAIAVNLDNDDFLQEINKTIDSLKEAEKIKKYLTEATKLAES